MADDEFRYASGFGNEFATEAVAGALPAGPQLAAAGAPRPVRRAAQRDRVHPAARRQPRSWVYRILPSAKHPAFRRIDNKNLKRHPVRRARAGPEPAALGPAAAARRATGSRTSSTACSPSAATATARTRAGMAVHLYAANASMRDRYFVDSDGELLFVPELGAVILHTELGPLRVSPGEIAVVPRGIRFRVELTDDVRPRLPVRELRRRLHPARARPDRRQRPGQRARLPVPARRLRGARPHRPGGEQVRRQPVGGGLRPLAARRGGLARELRAVQVRHGQLHGDRHDQLRPPGPVDLHRAHQPDRHPGPGQRATS